MRSVLRKEAIVKPRFVSAEKAMRNNLRDE